MALRDSLPSTWLLAVAALGGIVAGVLWGRAAPPERGRVPAPAPADPPASSPPPAPAPGRTFAIPGGPPPDVAREMEEALRGAFAGDGSDPAGRAAQDASFARVKALAGRWAAASGKDPLASAAWWRAALARSMAPAEPAAAGWVREEVAFLGESIPFLVSTPATAGAPAPAILCVVDAVQDPQALLEEHYGPLLATHAVVAVLLRHPRYEPVDPVMNDPRTALLAVGQAARGRALDRDRVMLDGFGRGAGIAALLAADSARVFCGAVLRGPFAAGEPAGNLALNPLLLIGPAAPEGPMATAFAVIREAAPEVRVLASDDFAGGYLDRAAAIAEWIAALPPRRVADPRRPFTWSSVTGDRWLSFGHAFVVKRTTGFGPGRTVKVRIERDPERNAVLLETDGVAEILLLLSDEGLDLERPVKVFVGGALAGERKVERSLDTVRTWSDVAEGTVFATAEWTLRIGE